MKWILVPVLAGLLLAPPDGRTAVAIAVAGQPSNESARGIQFGILEMARTAELLGGTVTLVGEPTAAYGVIAASGALGSNDVPTIHLAARPDGAGRCAFGLGAGEARGVLWHASLDRFGASELNERFVARYRTPMTSDAWAGWAAVKALGESALRRRPDENPCEALRRLRFDGHKGRSLFFDPESGVLVQPLYIVEGGRVVGEAR